jgi:hypothetical protein
VRQLIDTRNSDRVRGNQFLPVHPCWAFFDCFAGISSDMTLGALIDLGLPVEERQGLVAAPALMCR